ncbi:hypothetical protein JCM9140_1421 [Halalkalibacter wakoensis JCM 9140]|uniref:HEAT repeat protein n=1 Tax=Halalkalibacter wakoensis JCM 9140 TaxID=1236970 RepID=W4Q053_9BACI|nr:HEAT repeat domain-containing protein [Halalkalibacter wakoensis]GAE25426.1 hypothetical protein JCM9140_1421 [Halalkalibacter wakoensis JCM 9140]
MAYVFLLIVGLLVINLVLLLYLLFQKQIAQQHARKKEALTVELIKVVEDVARGRIEDIPLKYKRTSLFYSVLEETISHYLQIFNDEQAKKHLKVLCQSEFTSIYRKRLKSGVWSERMNALYYTEEFEMTSLKNEIWNYFQTNRASIEEKYQMIRTLAKLNDKRIVEQVKKSPNWPTFLLKECFRRFEISMLMYLMKNHLEELNENVQLALLDIAMETKEQSFLPFFDQLLFSEFQEVRVRALKAISEYEHTSKEEELTIFHQSEFWVERMMFARVAGQLKRKRYSSALVTLLSDESWWVRQAAAEALANYEDGLLILEYVYETSDDPFARDTAYQWLGEAVGEIK